MARGNAGPLSLFDELRREVDQLFEDFLDGFQGGSLFRPRAFPALNIWDDGDCLRAEAEVPGVAMDDLEVYAVGNELTIKGRRQPPQEQNVTYHRQERSTGEFARTVTLPVEVDAEKIEAVLKDGVLTVTLPKAETAKVRKITVKAG